MKVHVRAVVAVLEFFLLQIRAILKRVDRYNTKKDAGGMVPPTVQYLNQREDIKGAMLSFRLKNKKVMVIGNGPLAASRVKEVNLRCCRTASVPFHCICVNFLQVLAYGASITLATTQDDSSVYTVSETGENLVSLDRPFTFSDVVGQDMLICTSRDRDFSLKLYTVCRDHKVLANFTATPWLNDFSFTSTINKGSLQIGVSTNGRAPKIASRVAQHIESSLPQNISDAVEKVGQIRDQIHQLDSKDENTSRRMQWIRQICSFWPIEKLAQLSPDQIQDLLSIYQSKSVEDPPEDIARDRQDEGAEGGCPGKSKSGCNQGSADSVAVSMWEGPLSSTARGQNPTRGRISLVGAGPGDPNLLTVAAQKALETADLVAVCALCEHLVLFCCFCLFLCVRFLLFFFLLLRFVFFFLFFFFVIRFIGIDRSLLTSWHLPQLLHV